ncbi:DUF2007 domain-containing protein [Flavisericum labens]|uniref:DUF2007 domain-containing protein n=1 Tax=Flavisericum labens TaxID=3377112 RepID=UPI00387A93D9
MSNYIKVFSGSFIEVQRIFHELEKENIVPVIKDENESARLAGFGGNIVAGNQQIYVYQDELDKVVPLVKKLTSTLQE